MMVLLLASAAHAHHISGTVYCDDNATGGIDGGDTPLAGVTVEGTSIDVSPGETFSDATDATGFYSFALPTRTDRYLTQPIGLPGGFAVVVPGGGSYTIQIITGTAQDHADGVDFLITGCQATTTTTSSSTTTTSTTTTSTTTTTTTTLPGTCICDDFPFLVGIDGKYNNDATISGNVGANDPKGRIRTGRNVTMADSTRIAAYEVRIGNGSSVFHVDGTNVFTALGAEVRNGVGPAPALPLVPALCPLPAATCDAGQPVTVLPGESQALPPGVYGTLVVQDGASVTVAAGDYTFCEIRTGRSSAITAIGFTIVHVTGNVRIGSDSSLGPDTGVPLPALYIGGTKLRVSQGGVLRAVVSAPNVHATHGRGSRVEGCECTQRSKTDKHTTFVCVDQ